MEKIITHIATNNFLKSKFKEYYLTLRNENTPINLNQREWGFIFFDIKDKLLMKRHIYFESKEDLMNYISNKIPMHIFHSVAYYEKPYVHNMEEKLWNGADLIFDLDGDSFNIDGINSYSDMLTYIKKETVKLLEFLIDDFGFKKKQLEIVFSGNRGYHIHVYDKKIKNMNSIERREIVDYLTGKGIDFKYYIKELELYNSSKNKKINEKKYNLYNH